MHLPLATCVFPVASVFPIASVFPSECISQRVYFVSPPHSSVAVYVVSYAAVCAHPYTVIAHARNGDIQGDTAFSNSAVSNWRCTRSRRGRFQSLQSVSLANLPLLESIGGAFLCVCVNLSRVELSNLSSFRTIGARAFWKWGGANLFSRSAVRACRCSKALVSPWLTLSRCELSRITTRTV